MNKAEALGQLVRDQVAKAPVVGQHQQTDVIGALLGRGAHRHVVGDYRQLGLEIDAPVFAAKDRLVAGPQKIV